MTREPRRIVVTGSSKGLGLALASAFVHGGHSVEGCSRSGLPEVEVEFSVSPVDVRDRAAVERWAGALLSKGHVPDVLITNAALINEPAPLWKVSPAEVESIIATNVMGTSHVLQAFLPAMVERGRGLVITISSGWGRATDPEFAPYCASKYAVEGLTMSLAQELPSGMAAISLSPGVVRTDMLVRCWGNRALDYELPEQWAKRAAPFILELGPDANGSQLTVPPPPSSQ